MINNNSLSPEEIAHSWKGKFHFHKEVQSPEGDILHPGLRSPQIGALYSILAHLECEENENGIIVMPTGTGKTETMISFMVANQCVRTLVVVPSDSLRSQIGNKYKTLGLLRELGVIDQDIQLPKVETVIGKNIDWEKYINLTYRREKEWVGVVRWLRTSAAFEGMERKRAWPWVRSSKPLG